VAYITHLVLDHLSIRQSEATLAGLRVIDPSCGCGAFLLSTFRYILEAVQTRRRLTVQNRLDLLDCIFGTDVDSAAIQWARRALLLAVWEASINAASGEINDQSMRVPDLRKSILSGDFLTMPIAPIDAVVGGPPFVRLQQLGKSCPEKLEQYRELFRTARSGQFDLYMLFFEKAISILRSGGWLGWSTSNTFLRSQTGRTVRQIISDQCVCHELIEFEARKLYPDAVTQIVLIFLEKSKQPSPCRHIWIRGKSGLRRKLMELSENRDFTDRLVEVTNLPPTACRGGDWSLHASSQTPLLERMARIGTPLAELPIQLCSGVVTGSDEVFLVREVRKTPIGATIVRDRFKSDFLIDSALLRPIVRNRDISAFKQPLPKTLCIVPYDSTGQVLSENHLQEMYPRTYRYLQSHRDQLAARRCDTKTPWYAFRSSAALQLPPGPKVLLKRISSRPDSTLDSAGTLLCNGSVILLAPTSGLITPLLLLGILNSSIFWLFVRSSMPTMGDGHAIRFASLRTFRFPLPPTPAGCIELQAIEALVSKRLMRQSSRTKSAEFGKQMDESVARLYGFSAADFSGLNR
jgi:hypothetical protein